MQKSEQEYKDLLTSVIKKQMIVLGPFITLTKARNVKGLTIADDGTVTAMSGNPQELIQGLIDQFVQLSGLIVKKTMEPLLGNLDGLSAVAAAGAIPTVQTPAQTPQTPPAQPQQTQTPPAQTPTIPNQVPTQPTNQQTHA